MSDDERAIRTLVDTWMAATKSGDSAKVLSLMADDAVFMVPGHPPFGKEAFAIAAQGQSDVEFSGTNDILEIRVLGDWAYMRTKLTVVATPKQGNPVRRAGHTLTILRKQPDGQWVLFRDANLLITVTT